ncbi:MAG: LysM peptidoglycan-binding domain-containing protein [Deltaproteobacteria bacterium]|nr:LysM peptidoglycan-binding domain-containing protein [Deltaproteobacteria bacterium]
MRIGTIISCLLLQGAAAFAGLHPLEKGEALLIDEKADIFLVVQVSEDAHETPESIVRRYTSDLPRDRLAVILEDRQPADPINIPWTNLVSKVKARILLDLFPKDRPLQNKGWVHVVVYSDESFNLLSRLFHGDDDLILDLFTRLGRDIHTGDTLVLEKQDMTSGLADNLFKQAEARAIPIYEKSKPAGKQVQGEISEDDEILDQDIGANKMTEVHSTLYKAREKAIFLPRPKDGLLYKKDKNGELFTEYKVRKGNSLYSIAKRFTGRKKPSRINAAVRVIQRASGFRKAASIRPGDIVVIPVSLLGQDYKPPASPPASSTCHGKFPKKKGPLTYYRLKDGRVEARYTLKKGEALYSAVVIRFTGRLRAKEVNGLAMLIARYSGIKDVTKIPAGATVRIPIDYLDDPWHPCPAQPGAEVAEEPAEPEPVPPAAKGEASGFHFILDPGHGGIDTGALVAGMPEDEYAYDIATRLKRHLESAGGIVHMLLYDKKQKYVPRNVAYLRMDRNEVLLTRPRWFPNNPRRAVMVRVAMVNQILRKLIREKRISPEKIAFLSVHLDNLHPSVKGSFVYYPNKVMRRRRLSLGSGLLRRLFKAVDRRLEFNARFLARSQKESRSMAYRMVRALKAAGFPMTRRPVRYKIYRGRRVFSPAVVRYSPVVRALLLETFNLANKKERTILASPGQRELYARTVGDALIAELKSKKGLSLPPMEKDRGSPRFPKRRSRRKKRHLKKR